MTHVYAANLNTSTTRVADMFINGVGVWPPDWCDKWPLLNQVKTPNLIEGTSDRVMWRNSKGVNLPFTIKEAWPDWRINSEQVSWYNHVWFTQCVPKHAFILWLTIKNKLMTKYRIQTWSPIIDSRCSLCKSEKKTRDHIFFQCQFARIVWFSIKSMCDLHTCND